MTSAIDFSEHVRERSRHFVGREWVFRELDRWLKSDDRYFLITASPGFGKTAISAQLVNFSWGQAFPPSGFPELSPNFLAAIHFCSRADLSWCDPRIFASSISRQLASRFSVFEEALAGAELYLSSTSIHVEAHGGSAKGIEHFHAASFSGEEAFNRLVREPLNRLAAAMPDARILMLVDGLDEALKAGSNQIVELLSSMDQVGRNVRFILTSRSDQEVETAFGGARLVLSEPVNDDLNRLDLLNYVRTRSGAMKASNEEKALLDEAFAKQDNFLYAAFGLDLAAKLGIDETLFGLLAEGLDGLFYNWLNWLIRRKGKSWVDDYAPIIGPLVIASEKLSIQQLHRFSRLPVERIIGNLADLREFLTEGDGCQLYHQCFSEFFGHQTIKRQKSQLLNPYYLDAYQQHLAVVSAYKGASPCWNKVDWSQYDNYGLVHLVDHLAALRQGENPSDEIFDFLCPGLLLEKRARFGTDSSFLNDVDRVRSLAMSGAKPAIAEAVRCLSLLASLAESAAEIATQALAAYAWSGRPEVTTAWAALRRVANDHIAVAEFFLLHDRLSAAREALECAYQIARTQRRFRGLRLTIALMHRAHEVERPAQIVEEILRANRTPGQGSGVGGCSNKYWMEAFPCLCKGCAEIGDMQPMYAAIGPIPDSSLKLFCLIAIADAWMAVGDVSRAKKVLHKALAVKCRLEDDFGQGRLFGLANLLIRAGEEKEAGRLTKWATKENRPVLDRFVGRDLGAVESLFNEAFQTKSVYLLHVSAMAAIRDGRIGLVIEKAQKWRDEIEAELLVKSSDDSDTREATDRIAQSTAVASALKGEWSDVCKSLSLMRSPIYLRPTIQEVGEKLARTEVKSFEGGESVFNLFASGMDASLLRDLITAMRAYAQARHGNVEVATKLADECIQNQRRNPKIEPAVIAFGRIAEWLASKGKSSARGVAQSTLLLVRSELSTNGAIKAGKVAEETVARVETALGQPPTRESTPIVRRLSEPASEIHSGASRNPKIVRAVEIARAAVHVVATDGLKPLWQAIFALADEDLIEGLLELITLELSKDGRFDAAVFTSLGNLRIQAACRGRERFFSTLSEDIPVYWYAEGEDLLLRIYDRLANAERFWI